MPLSLNFWKTWHVAWQPAVASHLYGFVAISVCPFLALCLFATLYLNSKSVQRPHWVHHCSVFVGKVPKNNLVLIFPQIHRDEKSGPQHPELWHCDYVGIGPSCNPHPFFPGSWECNTLLTKSHFPFLSNFHTPVPLLRLAWPLKMGLGWHAYDSMLWTSPYFPSPPEQKK